MATNFYRQNNAFGAPPLQPSLPDVTKGAPVRKLSDGQTYNLGSNGLYSLANPGRDTSDQDAAMMTYQANNVRTDDQAADFRRRNGGLAHTAVPGYRALAATPQAATAPQLNPAAAVGVNAARAIAPASESYGIAKTSAYEALKNPYSGQYRAALVNQQRGDIQSEYSGNLGRIRQNMAERGLSEAGLSGIEQQAILQNEMGRTNALGRLGADSTVALTDKGAAWDANKAGQIDNYGLSRSGLALSYAGDARAAELQPGQVQSQGIANRFDEAAIYPRLAALENAKTTDEVHRIHELLTSPPPTT